jgi:glutamyl-tRNA synthetase
MHLGNAWTALLAWLQVRSMGGSLVLRMEDLDPDRSKPRYFERLLEDLRWLGLDWDEGPDKGGPYAPYYQDARRHLYEDALHVLERKGFLYPCYCSRAELRTVAQAPHTGEIVGGYPGTCRKLTLQEQAEKQREGRKASIRLIVPDICIEYCDLCYGLIRQEIAREVGDFIVRRADGVHAYQLAVVVDDAMMHISHVLRGADLLDSTPRQLLLYRLLNRPAPCFAHVPLFMGEDGQRLSKRHGDISIAQLRAKGTRAETIIGYLAYKANLFDRWEQVKCTDLIRGFELGKLPRNNIVICKGDIDKLIF